MDALVALRKEIEKKKRLQEEISVEGVSKQSKYVRRGDIEKALVKKRGEETEKDKVKKEKQRVLRVLASGGTVEKTSSEGSREGNGPSPDGPSVEATRIDGSRKEESKMPVEDVVRQLRHRGEPATLFGETDDERLARLRRVEMLQPEEMLGQRNVFQQVMEQVEMDQQKGKKEESEDEDEEEADCAEEKIRRFFRRLLKEWGRDLAARPESYRQSVKGKQDIATQGQTVVYMEPLFRHCRKRSIPSDVLNHISTIVDFMKKKEYVNAHDEYLKMAIGNAPWPMGVTMVGIHERSGRERIFSQNIAHVLNDETTRKYIQSIKRLLTFYQDKYPTNPSQMVRG